MKHNVEKSVGRTQHYKLNLPASGKLIPLSSGILMQINLINPDSNRQGFFMLSEVEIHEF
jgi:hypothetical protein